MIEVNKLTITNVAQYPGNGAPLITFQIDEKPYILHINEENGVYLPTGVQHLPNFPKMEKCQFCGFSHNVGNFCHVLQQTEILHALFHRVIEDNSIRLNWLYLPHI